MEAPGEHLDERGLADADRSVDRDVAQRDVAFRGDRHRARFVTRRPTRRIGAPWKCATPTVRRTPVTASSRSSFRSPSGDVGFYRGSWRGSRRAGCSSSAAAPGRVLLSIARDGIACTGLDSSEEMLEELRRKSPPENLRLVQGSMQDFDLQAERFGLIFSAFRSFQHLLTVEDQLACLRAVRRHLAPARLFAFDVFAPKLDRVALLEEPGFEEARWQEGDTEIVRFTSVRRDPATQVSEVTFRYERRRPGSADAEPRGSNQDASPLPVRGRAPARPGRFHGHQVFGGFDRRPFDYFFRRDRRPRARNVPDRRGRPSLRSG